MNLAAWVALLTAVFKFPTELLAIAKALQKTPEQKRQAIVEAATKVADGLVETGRPTWGP